MFYHQTLPSIAYLNSFHIRDCRMRNDNLLKHGSNHKFFILFSHRKCIVERSISNQSHLQFAITPGRSFAVTVVHLHLILVSTKWFLISGYQIKLTSSRWLVAVITHVAAGSAIAVRSARETLASKKTIVPVVARKRWKPTLGTDGIGE